MVRRRTSVSTHRRPCQCFAGLENAPKLPPHRAMALDRGRQPLSVRTYCFGPGNRIAASTGGPGEVAGAGQDGAWRGAGVGTLSRPGGEDTASNQVAGEAWRCPPRRAGWRLLPPEQAGISAHRFRSKIDQDSAEPAKE
jgi:hypothetical protein